MTKTRWTTESIPTQNGRVAIVTGAAQGIGRSIAERLSDDGARLVLGDLDETALAATVNELGDVPYEAGDLSQEDVARRLVDCAVSAHGHIDILVNNAGGAGDLQPLVELSDETFDETMKWNVYSTFWGTRRALTTMLAKQWGRVINISSTEGKVGKPVFTAYSTAKHAINGMTKAVAQEVGARGVTVNAICPGLVVTDIVKDNGPATAEAMGMTFEAMIEMFAQESAIKRPNTVEEVAEMAVLLASEAGGGITGAALSVDGGTAPY